MYPCILWYHAWNSFIHVHTLLYTGRNTHTIVWNMLQSMYSCISNRIHSNLAPLVCLCVRTTNTLMEIDGGADGIKFNATVMYKYISTAHRFEECQLPFGSRASTMDISFVSRMLENTKIVRRIRNDLFFHDCVSMELQKICKWISIAFRMDFSSFSIRLLKSKILKWKNEKVQNETSNRNCSFEFITKEISTEKNCGKILAWMTHDWKGSLTLINRFNWLYFACETFNETNNRTSAISNGICHLISDTPLFVTLQTHHHH